MNFYVRNGRVSRSIEGERPRGGASRLPFNAASNAPPPRRTAWKRTITRDDTITTTTKAGA